MYLFFTVFLFIFHLNLSRSESCEGYKTCGECIGSTFHCVWCPDKKHVEPRCISNFALESYGKSWCRAPVDPKTLPPSPAKYEKKSSIQFRPPLINITMRAGDTVHFKMSYKPALDYPIDIYYLMDNSFTMNFHKDALINQAQKIHSKLKTLSNNVQFGVGTFIEKLSLPYADSKVGHKLDTFTNRLPLTEDIDKFVEVVKTVQYSANYDIPESALDALMQVMLCDEIEWRKNARRMIILSTDAPYHSAGDGKFVQAYKPNDMRCHLTNGSYDAKASLLYDYPSVSQINKVAIEKEISITFAVLKEVEDVYKALVKQIKLANYVELKNSHDAGTGSELVNLIADEYKKLALSLEIDRGSVPSHFDLKIEPACNKTEKCHVPSGETIELDAYLTAKSCPTDGKYKDTLKIGPSSLHEKVEVNVEILCECKCEKEGQEFNSKLCNGGTYQCGVCKCNKNTYGKVCECNGTSTEELDQQKCKVSLNDTALCSGRGDCVCGECKCWDPESFVGSFCQFKNNNCPVYDNKVCGGNGKCNITECLCIPGWKGADCSCTTLTDTCVGANSKICSGNGDCSCGDCICKGKYSGKYCDSCDTCIEDRCKELGPYVECIYNNEYKSTCDKKFDVINNRTVMILNRTEIKASDWKEWRQANSCKRILADSSRILFKYLDARNSTCILIQKEKELPPEANIWNELQLAREKCKKAESESDLVSDSEQSKKKRKRKPNIFSSDTEDEEDENYIPFKYPDPPKLGLSICKSSRKEAKKTLTTESIAAYIAGIQSDIQELKTTQNDILSRLTSSSSAALIALPDEIALPLKSLENLDNIETWLENDENKENLVNNLSFIGGNNIATITRRILQRVFCSLLAVQCNWTGKNNKTSLKKLQLIQVIIIPIGSAIGSVLLIGILTVIAWKVLVDIYDDREYKKFLKDAAEGDGEVCENILYQPANVNINNPAYCGNM